MKTPLMRLTIGLTLALLGAGLGSAATLNYNSWQTEPFTLMNPGDFFPTAYTAAGSGSVNVTGYFETGDFYNVYVNGSLALTTTQVLPANVDYGDQNPSLYADPASAFPTGLFSTGRVDVNTGDVITIADLAPPGGIGEVGLQLVAPEPASFYLLALGMLGAMLVRRKQTANSVK